MTTDPATRLSRIDRAASNLRRTLMATASPIERLRLHGRIAAARDRADGGQRVIREIPAPPRSFDEARHRDRWAPTVCDTTVTSDESILSPREVLEGRGIELNCPRCRTNGSTYSDTLRAQVCYLCQGMGGVVHVEHHRWSGSSTWLAIDGKVRLY
jgi:hypothetical protein